MIAASEVVVERLHELASMQKGDDFVRITSATCVLKMGHWNPAYDSLFEDQLFGSRWTLKARLQFIGRLSTLPDGLGLPLLTEVVKRGGPKEAYLAIAALTRTGAIEALGALRNELRRMGLEAIIDETRAYVDGSNWTGSAATQLRNELKKIYISSSGELIQKLKAKDSTGRWAYYFVLVEKELEADFLAAIKGNGEVDLEIYGQVIASCYGEAPTDEVIKFLNDEYGFVV
ncbi:hypothetical protein [Methylopila sp. M107]|uniref:hypothetical protein n=1 Tax=Methylopila sp. M107 TaxID=1101190 RepID=UPI0003643B42|nr:hypothetical protein [Methylopila sp. M107]